MGTPIVVTGSHRSGTTWVGRMLALSGEAGYIHEPLNPVRRPTWSRKRVPHWYLYITTENQRLYEPIFEDLFRFRYPLRNGLRDLRTPAHAAFLVQDLSRSLRYRIINPRPLLKDPFALFASEWLASRYGARIVVMVRHPAAFVSSLKKLNWQFKFEPFLEQPALLRDWLHPFESQIRYCHDHDVDVIEQGIVLWNALHHVIGRLQRAHRDWIFLRHEDLARTPVDGFADLYARLGLPWSDDAARRIGRYSSSGAMEVPRWRHTTVRRHSEAATMTWRTRLDEDEIERVREGTEEIGRIFYPESEW